MGVGILFPQGKHKGSHNRKDNAIAKLANCRVERKCATLSTMFRFRYDYDISHKSFRYNESMDHLSIRSWRTADGVLSELRSASADSRMHHPCISIWHPIHQEPYLHPAGLPSLQSGGVFQDDCNMNRVQKWVV